MATDATVTVDDPSRVWTELSSAHAARIEELGGKPFIFGTPVVSDGEVRTPAAPCVTAVPRCAGVR